MRTSLLWNVSKLSVKLLWLRIWCRYYMKALRQLREQKEYYAYHFGTNLMQAHEEAKEMVVQVNGKQIGTISIFDMDELQTSVLAHKLYLKQCGQFVTLPSKVVTIPGKLVNLIVKDETQTPR